MSDSMNNLKRALRQISQGTFRKLAFWTILTVAAETLAIDLASSLFQLVSLGHIQQQLLLSPDLLGLPRTRGILPGHILLLLSGLIVFSLGLRLFFGQVCEKLTGLIESSIAGELRTRLFRECHRTSGQLITPDAAEQTLSLIQSAARDYGRARSLILRQRLAYLVRGIAGILLLGLVRWDISLMVSAGIFLSFILELRYQEKSQTCEALDNQVEQKIRNEFHEELRESYQARVIGSERGKGRPSDDWIERWSQIDQKSQNVRLLNVSTRNWGRLAIFSTVLFALSIRISAGQTLSTGSTIALLTVMSCSFLSWIFSRFGVGVFQDDSKWIIPIHKALSSEVRIWDIKDALTMKPCQQGIQAVGLPKGISPTDPRSATSISFDVPAFKVTAIVCPDVVYRRKLMRWMARWEDPFQGAVLLDSKDLREYSIASTRLQIGSIRSDSYVNDGSVIENITLNDPRGDLLSAISAARDVHAHRMIQKLPEGYSTWIHADNPYEQSVYDRFLIALARGRWHDPSILLVEEPSPSMSRGMRELLRDSYRRLARERTLVVFTRHAASVLAADHVVIIGSRKLMQGSPADLIQKNPKFKRAMRQIGMGVERKSKKESPGTTKRAETGIGSQKTDTQA